MEFELNGRRVEIPAGAGDAPLLWILREHFGLVGAKFGCGVGACGARTVHLDGRAERSCLLAATDVAGRPVTTIEGLSGPGGALHPVQRAWIDESVPQCGYCQAGQIMQAAALLAETPRPTPTQVDETMSGVLCRCGTQARVRRAVARAAGTEA